MNSEHRTHTQQYIFLIPYILFVYASMQFQVEKFMETRERENESVSERMEEEKNR